MSDYKIQITNKLSGTLNTYYEVQITEGGSRISINTYPFGNCQNFTIGYFSNIIDVFGASNLFDKIREIKTLCGISKPFLVVDLRQDDISLPELRQAVTVVRSAAYINANDSEMRIVVIDTRRKP